ncbi:MAG: PilZ domain-containing protein [Desulfobacterales bacterium]|nr:MAG: PilZ domain-containing protein [Desulfobacterales bacterium]
MANNDNKTDINDVRSRLSKIISSMSEIELQKLLKGLEKWQASSRVSKRKHPRKDASIYAFLEADDLTFNDFIKNVSSGGLYIETEAPLSVNKELFIRFLHPDTGSLTRITGKIVRVDAKGFGIQFEEPRPDL